MCGLVYVHNTKKKPVANKLVKRYMNQRTRGTQGFGVYRPLHDKLAHNTKEKKMLKHLKKLDDPILMFHHRMPTFPRENVVNACHPFATKQFFENEYILIHNGGISNRTAMKEKHDKLGIKYVSMQPNGDYCDSECLLWEVALYLEGKQDKMEAAGNIAFICYVKDKDGKKPLLYFGRNTNPLHMNKGKNTFTLASEGEGAMIDQDKLYCYNYVSGKLTDTKLDIPRFAPYKPNPSPVGASNSGFRGNTYTPGSTAETVARTYKQPASTTTTTGSPAVPNSKPIGVKQDSSSGSSIITTAERSDKAFADLIKKNYKKYLDEAHGLFADATWYILQDMEELETTSPEDYAVLQQVYTLLDEDNYNLHNDSIHPDYVVDHFPHLNKIGFFPERNED